MFLQTFGEWLYDTPVATGLRETTWVIPAVQSIHILAIAVVIGSALVSELRLAGVIATDEAPGTVVRRYLPWIWRALIVLLLSGTVLIVAEPARTLGNTVFWIKMGLVLGAFVLTLSFRRPLLVAADGVVSEPAKAIAWLLLVVWVVVIFCGRFIAYT
ncbi:DUF6644 family protein [Novosphingobium cyanobacteriorum]|uniref:DUF6644 domain-containing protein n=1 Tax=Novosphingobium cyanobacteriorum TaxID=3024215 RepID=A0ABT6CJM8_9SPHN|nr:DUF6644 family protein [Novosphingobium cyanobacteriorum]MDF8333739.1 hypothetical protein [Novosphingobium cyanobacteriorum]